MKCGWSIVFTLETFLWDTSRCHCVLHCNSGQSFELYVVRTMSTNLPKNWIHKKRQYTGYRLQRVRLQRVPGHNEQFFLSGEKNLIDINVCKVPLKRIPLVTSKLLVLSGIQCRLKWWAVNPLIPETIRASLDPFFCQTELIKLIWKKKNSDACQWLKLLILVFFRNEGIFVQLNELDLIV